ncbi:hypothetical protein DFR50_12164 [Roseiarcus fermentans]|uniref:Uncharacterized protein n=1 Tax=Roseiarcus fermentans TaxID=1473586 RepID=A0A366F7I3_9HYPH|nr:hypothetical protein [Roseiarcus fermentans]RBP09719.1 hypothetical protein DFR50_12164 [Roseiarcus fermentans]
MAHAEGICNKLHNFIGVLQPTPAVIPIFVSDPRSDRLRRDGATIGRDHHKREPLLQALGVNHRTGFSCHQPATGWSISAASARQRFGDGAASGADPLFRLAGTGADRKHRISPYIHTENYISTS